MWRNWSALRKTNLPSFEVKKSRKRGTIRWCVKWKPQILYFNHQNQADVYFEAAAWRLTQLMKTRPFLWTCLVSNRSRECFARSLLWYLEADWCTTFSIERHEGPPVHPAFWRASSPDCCIWCTSGGDSSVICPKVLRQAVEVWMWFKTTKTTTCLDRFLMISFCANLLVVSCTNLTQAPHAAPIISRTSATTWELVGWIPSLQLPRHGSVSSWMSSPVEALRC